MAKIIIDGVEHDFAEEFNLGEARIIKRYTGLNLRELENLDPSDPDFLTACMHILHRREQPGLTFAEYEAMGEALNPANIETVLDGEEVASSPPAPSAGISDSATSEPSNGSQEASPEITTPSLTGTPL